LNYTISSTWVKQDRMRSKSNRAPTLTDVAERAGVNRVTVSVVLNSTSRAGTRVSESTRQRILKAAADLCYQPNAIARSLRRRRTNTIGFYSGYPQIYAANPFKGQIISGLQIGCDQLRQDLLLHGKYPGRSAEDIYAELANGRIDGLVLFTPPDDALIERLVGSHLPVVAIVDAVPILPSVVADDAVGGCLQAEHLAARGHRRVIYQTAHLSLISTCRRYAAFCEAAAARGMSVLESRSTNVQSDLTDEARAALLGASAERRATAIVAWQDGVAVWALSQCIALGLRVPEQVAVVGFDGIGIPSHLQVGPTHTLTTIRAPWTQVAQVAVSLLVSEIEGKEVPKETVLPVELFVGDTT
jgi:DNA-binding LacI/PurR family transcriptional regulator